MLVRVLKALCLGALCATPALAGTVVLENGQVVIGKIKQEEANEDSVTVRWPYKDFKPPMAESGAARGEWKIPMHIVRWLDVDADGPTDLYWAEFADLVVSDDWKGEQQRWQLRKASGGGPEELPGDEADEAAAALITGKGEEPAETPAATPAPAETPAASTPAPTTPAPAAPPADSGSGFCSLRPVHSGGGAAWLALLGLGLVALRRRGA